MIKKISDWLFGSFFRTLGKLLALVLLIYLLIALASKSNIKLPFMKISALQIYKDNGKLYNFPDLPDNITKFFIYRQWKKDTGYTIHMVGWNESNYVFYPKITSCNGNLSYYQMKSLENEDAIVHVDKYDLIDGEWIYNSNITADIINLDSNYYILTNNSKGVVGNDNSLTPYCMSYSPITLYDQHKITIHTDDGIITDSFFQNQKVTYNGDVTYFYANKTLSTLFRNISISKDGFNEVGLYYDQEFTQQVDLDAELTGDLDIYVLWENSELSELINEINFEIYMYNKNYDYGFINIGANKGQKVYLAFKTKFENLELYTYDKTTNKSSENAILCLNSIGKIDGWYYYEFETNRLNLNEIVLLVKKELEKGNEDKFIFKLSDNASMTYTNDLKKSPIIDETGKTIIIDLNDAYINGQAALVRENSNILGVFNDLFKNKNSNIFTLFSNVWEKIKSSNLYLYILSVIVGSIIIIVIKSANRR